MKVLIYFLDSLAAPLFLSLSLRQDRNKVIHHFVFLMQCIYCELMFCLPNNTCMVRMASSCQFFSVSHAWSSIYSIFFSLVASFSSCGHFVSLDLSPSSLSFPPFSGKFFLWALPFPLFSSFHGRFSLVRLDYPSFFARFCSLLESIGRKRPKVGLFVGRDCPYRFILLFLFPLVHRSVGIA